MSQSYIMLHSYKTLLHTLRGTMAAWCTSSGNHRPEEVALPTQRTNLRAPRRIFVPLLRQNFVQEQLNRKNTRLWFTVASTTTRGGADTAERQHLHASGRVSFLQLLILPTPDRNDISSLSNLHQRWALKMPLHLLVPPTLHSQATSGWVTGLLGAAVGRGMRAQEWEKLNAAT